MRKRLLSFTLSVVLALIWVTPAVLFADDDEVFVEAPSYAQRTRERRMISDTMWVDLLKVSWSAVSSADGYEIYRRCDNDFYDQYLASVQDVETYTDTTTRICYSYMYKVRAYREVDGVIYYSDFAETLYSGKGFGFLEQVEGFSAEPKSGVTMRLSWDRISGTNRYYITVKTGDSYVFDLCKYCRGTQSSTSITGLTAGTKYTFQISAEYFTGTDFLEVPFGYSEEIEAVALATPSVNAFVSDSGEITVGWTKASRSDGYEIYRSESEDGSYRLIQTVGDVLTYKDSSAEAGTAYYYKVRAYKEVDGKVYYGGYSNAAMAEKAKYEGLKVSPKSGVTMNLSWTTVPGAGLYEIWHRTENTEFEYVKTAGKSQTSTTHTGLKAGSMHYYKIVIKDASGNFLSESTEVSAVALATPAIDKVSSCIEWSKGYIQVCWSKASGAGGYNIYRCVGDENGTYQYVASVQNVESYRDSDINAENYYKVRAYKKVDGKVYYGGYSKPLSGYEFEMYSK